MIGQLYLIPNTLGSAADQADMLASVIPAHVQQITACLDYFVAENAKTARAYLKLINATQSLAKPIQDIQIVELNVNTDEKTLPLLLAPIIAGRNGGLLSEAGVPAVADPGANLVRLAHERGIIVKPLVGPSSILLAVMASGMNGQSFAFNGYLPTDATLRVKKVKELEDRSRRDRQTQLFIETPYRNRALLEALIGACQGNSLVGIAVDLTLPSEMLISKPANEWKKFIASGQAPDLHKRPTVFSLLAQ